MRRFFLPALVIVAIVATLLTLRGGSPIPLPGPDLGSRRGTLGTLDSLPGSVTYVEGQTSVPVLFDRANRLLAERRFPAAESTYRRIVSLEPGSAPGHVGIATSRFYRNDYAVAEEHYRRALALDPRSSMALMGLGSVAGRTGRFREAIEAYEHALELRPDLDDVHWGLALVYDSLGDGARALAEYRVFLERAPESAQAAAARVRSQELRAQLER